MRLIGVAAAAVALTFSAAAEEVAPFDAREALTAAIDVAKSEAQSRWAFTMAYTEFEDEGEKTYKLRYDPRRAEGARWTLLDPALEMLSKDEKKDFKKIQKNDEADDGLIYDRLEIDFDETELTEEDETRATFVGPIIDEEIPEKMRDTMVMTVTVNKPGRYVESISLHSTGEFKPALVAKIKTFKQTQQYKPLSDGGPALMRTAQSDVSGKAMLKKFESKTETIYSDFERVEVVEGE